MLLDSMFSRLALSSVRRRFSSGKDEYTCGIPPWEVEKKVIPKPLPKKLPAHLIRPPCVPGSDPGGYQTCERLDGMYCPPCRVKYKYPPFSENIDFVPGGSQATCWWRFPPACDPQEDDQLKSFSIPRDCYLDGVI